MNNKIKKYNIKNIMTIFVVMFLALVIIVAIFVYTKSIENNTDESAQFALGEIIALQKDTIYTRLYADMSMIESLALSFSTGDVPKNKSIEVIKKTMSNNDFKDIIIFDLEGNGQSSSGEKVTITNADSIERLNSTESKIYEDSFDIEDEHSIKISTPVLDTEDGSIKYVIVGIYNFNKINEFVERNFGENGNIGIVDSEGKIIYSNYVQPEEYASGNVYIEDQLSKIKVISGDSNIIENLRNGNNGSLAFEFENEYYYCKYINLGINDWYIIANANKKYLALSVPFSSKDAIVMSFVVVICIGLLVIYFIFVRNRAKKELENIALYDKITGLPSSEKFKMQINQVLLDNKDAEITCIVFDICNFKLVNDRFGSIVGDQMLNKIADVMRKMQENSPAGSLYPAKLYSDTFAMLVVGMSQEKLEKKACNFLEICREESLFIGEYNLNLSSGKYVSQEGDNGEIILERALTAHSHSKDDKPNKFVNYDMAFIQRLHTRSDILDNFNKALQNEEFKVYLQPQYKASNEKISGAEVLVRWIVDGEIKYPPFVFIPVLEDASRISELDSYLREQVCKIMRNWLDKGMEIVPVSLNVSRVELLEENFVTRLLNLVNKYQIEPTMLHIEITETAYVGDYEYLIQVVNELSSHGFHVEMDDFGSGYSSLNVLKDIPVDIVKLDMKFVEKGANEARSGSILSSVVRMTQGINLITIAEGVETREQIDYLRSIGCDYMQGYYFAKPMPVEEFEEILKGQEVKGAWKIDSVDKKVGIDNAANFLDATAQETLLFNTFLGGAAIVEYTPDTLSAIRVNDKFYEVFNQTPETVDFFKCNLLDMLVPDQRAKIVDLLEEAIKTGQEVSGETSSAPMSEGDGVMWQSFNLRCLGVNGNRYILYLALNDITLRKNLEASLKAEIDKSQALIESMPGGYIKTDLTNGVAKVVFASKGIIDRVGYTLEELQELGDINATVHPDDLQKSLETNLSEVQNGVPFTVDQRYIAKDGHITWFRSTGTFTRMDDDMLNGTFEGFLYDITALQEAKQKVETFINNTSDGYVQLSIVDGEIRTEFVSKGFCDFTGYSYEEAMTYHMNSFVHPDDLEMVEKVEMDTIVNGAPYAIEYRFRHKNGKYIWVREVGRYVSSTTNANSGSFYGSYFDISHYKEVQQKLAQTQEELEKIRRKLENW